jgi:hypothetical protein
VRLRRVGAVVESCQLIVDKKFCTGGSDKRACAREAEESLLLEAVAKERLMKTAGWRKA